METNSNTDSQKKLLFLYRENLIDSTQVLQEISKVKIREMSIAKEIKEAFDSYDSLPNRKESIKKLVVGFSPIFIGHLALIDNPTLTFKKFIEDSKHRISHFEDQFPTDNDKEKFWVIIDLISDELNKID